MIFPSRTVNVNVWQNGRVIGVSTVSGSSAANALDFLRGSGHLVGLS
jgi:hypothetical protein